MKKLEEYGSYVIIINVERVINHEHNHNHNRNHNHA